jgi:glyoxylate utilization-related uncharacterized protein
MRTIGSKGGEVAAFTIARDDELERAYDTWVLVRKSLGLAAFGLNIVELPSGGSIPEHHEVDRGQEEVFYVIEGSPTITIDGVDHPLEAGTFVRLDPEPVRTVRNDGDATASVMIVSAPTTSGYEPMGWA